MSCEPVSEHASFPTRFLTAPVDIFASPVLSASEAGRLCGAFVPRGGTSMASFRVLWSTNCIHVKRNGVQHRDDCGGFYVIVKHQFDRFIAKRRLSAQWQ